MSTVAALRNTGLSSVAISFNSTGDNTIISAVANQGIRIYHMFFISSAATNLIFKDSSTALTGTLTMVQGGAFALDPHEDPWFVVSVGGSFVINQSGTATIGGICWYGRP